MADSPCAIVLKKRVVSPVWDYFGLRADNEGKVIDDGVAHLRTHHPSQYTQVG